MASSQQVSPPSTELPSAPGLANLFAYDALPLARKVIEDALRRRKDAGQGARDALNSAIDHSGINLDGFKKVSNAPTAKLALPITSEIVVKHNHKLAGALLEVWRETQPALASAATSRLEQEGLLVRGGKREYFDGLTPPDSLRRHASRVCDELGEAECSQDEAAYMLAYISGLFPQDLQPNSSLFSDWIGALDALPPEAPEWDEASAFADRVNEMALARREARAAALSAELSEMLDSIPRNFSDELQYLEIDPLASGADFAAHALLLSDGKRLLGELNDALESYSAVRPQAATASEERLRAEDRNRRAEEVSRLVQAWQKLADSAQEADFPEESGDADSPVEQPAESDLSAELRKLQNAHDNLRAENVRLAKENADAQQANLLSEGERDSQQLAYDKLRTEKDEQSEENSQLRRELHESRRREHALRLALKQREIEQGTELPPPKSVSDAIEAARQAFPDRLEIALNSASKADNSYKRPAKVFDALQWLATEYYDLRANPPGADPEYDRRLKESCNGWSFSNRQSDTAKNMFPGDYKARANGKSYTLDAHIGEGTKGNPQNMIRIAFAWDDVIEKVIVGYIGPHQRTKAS